MSYEEVKSSTLNENDSAEAAGYEESFAALLEKSSSRSTRLAPGQKVRSKIVSISGDLVYIDLGGKSEGVIDLNEFRDKEGTIRVQEGDEIEAFFVTSEDGIRKLTTKVNGYSAVTLNAIRDAHDAGLPVNGEVRREIRGGFEISVGEVRCFCPFSQIDLKGGREGGVYLGRTFPFKILEYEENGRNIIVSRRILLEQEKQERIDRLRQTLENGMEVAGTVRSIQKFGVFIDLGGIDGLIPTSEVSWNRTENAADLLSVGQQVTAKIISLDWDNNRLTFSLKAMQPDPWTNMVEKYPVGSRVSATIVRLVNFGAFVNLEPGIDGLIHISNLGAGRRINHPKEVAEVGQRVEAYVLAVDPQSRKISLSMQPKAEPKKIVLPEAGEILEGTVEKVMPYGIFLKMNNGLTGLIPNSETGTPSGTDLRRMFPSGTEMQVIVTEVDTVKNKVRLSRKAVMEMEVKEEYDQYVSSVNKGSSASGNLGSLGEILKAKMEEKKLNS